MSDFRNDTRFRSVERLRKRHQFRHVERRQYRFAGRDLIIYVRENDLDWSRLGLTVTRKVGAAPARNRWKRRLRAIFRNEKGQIPSGIDIVAIVKRGDRPEPAFSELSQEFIELVSDAHARSPKQ